MNDGWRQTGVDHWVYDGVGEIRRLHVLRIEGIVDRFRPYDAHGNQLDNGYKTLANAKAAVMSTVVKGEDSE